MKWKLVPTDKTLGDVERIMASPVGDVELVDRIADVIWGKSDLLGRRFIHTRRSARQLARAVIAAL